MPRFPKDMIRPRGGHINRRSTCKNMKFILHFALQMLKLLGLQGGRVPLIPDVQIDFFLLGQISEKDMIAMPVPVLHFVFLT